VNRRHFLLSTAASGVGLILPAVAERILAAVAATNAPVIEPSIHASRTLFAVDLGGYYQLNLDSPEADFPETYKTTWREYLAATYRGDLQLGMSDFDIRPEQLDTIGTFETDVEQWALTESPNARAFRLLSNLDIGPRWVAPSGGLGYIEFVDGDGPGNDYRGVHVPDDISLSLLQVRLDALKTGLQLVVA
jgi:hypothetical protein